MVGLIWACLFTSAVLGAEITSIGNLRAMRAPLSAGPLIVTVRGAVNWMSSLPVMAIGLMDDTASIYSVTSPQLEGKWNDLRVGQELELTAEVVFSGYAPYLKAGAFRVIGERTLPDAVLVTPAVLLTGQMDAQRVAVSGVVEAVNDDPAVSPYRLLRCLGLGGYFTVRVTAADWSEPDRLVDARIRATGLVITLCNTRKEVTGVQVSVPRAEDLQIERVPLKDPFTAPRRSLGALLPFSHENPNLHRCVTSGTVTFASKRQLFIQDQERAAQVERWTGDNVVVGDLVEVAAFVDQHQIVAGLHDALIRKVGKGEVLEPVSVSPEAILRNGSDHAWRGWEPLPADFDGRLARLQGHVRAREQGMTDRDDQAITLLLQANEGAHFECVFPPGFPTSAEMLTPGCLLDVAGVVRLDYSVGDHGPEFSKPRSVSVLVRGPNDVKVLAHAGFWTRGRFSLLLAGTGPLVIILGVWTWGLRRHLKKQALVIARHLALEAEHSATIEERSRLAGELHDGVQQIIAGVSLQLESARHALPDKEAGVSKPLDIARHLVVRAREEIRRCVWALRDVEDSHGSLSEGLRKLLEMQRLCADADFKLTTEGDCARRLPQRVLGALVLVAQEAITNAVKHGKATVVSLHLKCQPEELSLTITDNGCGFDTQVRNGIENGHMGLVSMRDRMTRLGGHLAISSELGQGTVIHARLTWDTGDEKLAEGVIATEGASVVATT